MIDSAAPIDTTWFQKRLDEATRDRNIELRIVWAPTQVVSRIIDYEGNTQVYKKYPVVEGYFVPWVLGHFFRRNGVTVGYQKAGGLITGDVLPTDLAVPHLERVNPSAHIFVIERKLPDEYARRLHAQKRRLALKHVGIDLFGDFPEEGIWDWFDNISDHRDDCCEMARSAGVPCRGLYRDPDERDLEKIRQALKVRDELPMKDRGAQIEQAAKDMATAQVEYARRDFEDRKQNAGEIGRLAQIALEHTRIALDPAKQFKETTTNGNASD